MTRTITGAVHRLYEGTSKIREGEISHRITVAGRDQLGELAQSFNQMTENLERLIVVEKEKERLASELEIARDRGPDDGAELELQRRRVDSQA